MIKSRLSSMMVSAITLTVFAATPALAQGDRPIGFGPLAGMIFDGSTPFLGAAFRVGTPLMVAENPVMFDADFEYFLDTGDATVWSLQAAMLLPLVLEGSQVKPVIGAGLGFQRTSVSVSTPIGGFGASSSDVFLSLMGGVMVRAFFADIGFRVKSGSTLVARVGFLGIGNIL